MPRPIRRSTSKAWMPVTRSASWPRLAFGIPLSFDKAHVEGITKIEAIDIRYAEEMGYRIKLLGMARRRAAMVRRRLSSCACIPTLIPGQAPDCQCRGRDERGAGEGRRRGRDALLRRGCGGGAQPTASVIADLVDVARLIDPM